MIQHTRSRLRFKRACPGMSCFHHFVFSLNGLYLENGWTEDIEIVHDAVNKLNIFSSVFIRNGGHKNTCYRIFLKFFKS